MRSHPRKKFLSGQALVDDWLATKALQNHEKRLSTTIVLVDDRDAIAGFYTLATGQVDFNELPNETAKKLPKRMLPAAVLAWLGISIDHQGQGLGQRLLARALLDCYEASQIFAFIAVILDCVDDAAKSFYLHHRFEELSGQPYKLFLPIAKLDAMFERK